MTPQFLLVGGVGATELSQCLGHHKAKIKAPARQGPSQRLQVRVRFQTLIQAVIRTEFLTESKQRPLFLCWLTAASLSSLLKATCILCHLAPSTAKRAAECGVLFACHISLTSPSALSLRP